MKTKYLLPCSCGQEIPVEAGQAGQTVRCHCGAELEVPTLLRMSSLKPAEPEPQSTQQPPGRWGARQRLVVVGALIVVPALALIAYLLMTRPRLEAVPTHVPLDRLTLGQTWQIWQDLRSGIQRRPTVAERYYRDQLKLNRQWLGVAAVLCLVGLVVMASSLFVPRRRRPPPPRRTPPEDPGVEQAAGRR